MIGNSKKWRGQAKVFVAFIAVFAVLLFVLSFGNTVLAGSYSPERDKDSLQGEIVALDNSNHIITLTLRSEDIGNFPNDTMNIFLNRDTKVKVCSVSEPARDINVGRNAEIRYHVSGSVIVADALSERC